MTKLAGYSRCLSFIVSPNFLTEIVVGSSVDYAPRSFFGTQIPFGRVTTSDVRSECLLFPKADVRLSKEQAFPYLRIWPSFLSQVIAYLTLKIVIKIVNKCRNHSIDRLFR